MRRIPLILLAVVLVGTALAQVFDLSRSGFTPPTGEPTGGSFAYVFSDDGDSVLVCFRRDYGYATTVSIRARQRGFLNVDDHALALVSSEDTTAHTMDAYVAGTLPWQTWTGDTLNFVALVHNEAGTIVDTSTLQIIADAPGRLINTLVVTGRAAPYGLNTAAADSGWARSDTAAYDRVVKCDTTTHRYWQGQRGEAGSKWNSNDFALYNTSDAEGSLFANSDYAGMFTLDLEWLPDDAVIDKATLILSAASYAGIYAGTTYVTYVVMDTCAADLGWVNAPRQGTLGEAPLRNCSYEFMALPDSIPWPVTWHSRQDYSDVGPRSEPNPLNVTASSDVSQAGRWDVTDLIQQYVLRGDARVNAGFMLTGTRAANQTIALGTGSSARSKQPMLHVRWHHGSPSWPWGEEAVPVVLMMDDGRENALTSTVLYASIIDSAGGTLGLVTSGNTIGLEGKLTPDQVDSLVAAGHDFIWHSRTHSDMGGFDPAVDFDYEFSRTWYANYMFDSRDTANVEFSDFAWPVLSAAESTMSLEAIAALVDHDYRSARAPDPLVWRSRTGRGNRLSWDNPTNVYNIAAYGSGYAFGTESYDSTEMREKILDYVDDAYYDGRSALVIYWHNHPDDDYTASGATYQQLRWLVGFIAEWDNAHLADWQALIGRYFTYHQPVPLADLGDIAPAMYDSAYTAGLEQMGEVWWSIPAD